MRRAAKVDRNQIEIVTAARAVGASVQPIHTLGKGVPDLLIGYRGVNLLWEIKDGLAVPSRRVLTPDEAKWHRDWRGSIETVTSVAEALEWLRHVPHQ